MINVSRVRAHVGLNYRLSKANTFTSHICATKSFIKMERAVVCREVCNQYTGMWGFDTGRDGHWGRQPLLKVRKSATGGFKKKSSLGLKSLQKNPRNKKTWDYLWIAFCRTENEGRKPNKNSSLGLCPETSTKKVVQELHISSPISKFS
jgi:hypothetical protein